MTVVPGAIVRGGSLRLRIASPHGPKPSETPSVSIAEANPECCSLAMQKAVQRLMRARLRLSPRTNLSSRAAPAARRSLSQATRWGSPRWSFSSSTSAFSNEQARHPTLNETAEMDGGRRVNESNRHCCSDGGRKRPKIIHSGVPLPFRRRYRWSEQLLSHRPIDAPGF